MADILTPIAPLTTTGATNLTAATPLPITGLLNLPWAAYWTTTPHSSTPQGPFTSSDISGLGNVTDDERIWMTQYLLNASIDTPPPPPTINYGTDLLSIQKAGQFRILQNYQMKFLVQEDGTFGDFASIHNAGDIGTTKVHLLSAFPASLIKYFNLNLSDLTIKVNGETNDYNLAENISTDRLSESGYATARLGPPERNVQWRMWGADAPWVYSEVVFHLDSGRAVTTSIRMSADITWQNGTVTAGSHPFNNLTIYKMNVNNGLSSTDPGKYFFQGVEGGNLSMNGSLQYFLSTGSSTWGDSGTPPSF